MIWEIFFKDERNSHVSTLVIESDEEPTAETIRSTWAMTTGRSDDEVPPYYVIHESNTKKTNP